MAAASVLSIGVTGANAAPISLYYSFDGTNFTQLGSTSTTGTNGVSGATLTNGATTFSVSINSIGTGSSGTSPLPQPNFATTTVDVNTAGTGTLYLAAVESGLTNTNVGSFKLGFTNNADSNVPVTEGFYASSSLNLATTPLASSTMAPNSTSNPVVSAPALTSPYSVAVMYQTTFGASGGLADATIAETATVPEPMSLSLLGASLVGLGILRRKRT